MKHLKLYLRLFLISGLLLYMNSCTDDNDPGPGPVSDDRNVFVGLWSVTENSSIFGQSVYDSEIQKNSADADNIAIDNFYQLGLEVITQAEVNGSQLAIPQQTITQKTIVGSGELVDKNTIHFDFTVDDGAAIDTVIAIYTRK